MDLPFIIQQGMVLLGILATVVLGVLSRTGPRRHVENIKLAAEALKAVDDPIVRYPIHQYITKQNSKLRRSLDRAALRLWVGIVAGVLLGCIAILVTNLLLDVAFPQEPDEATSLNPDEAPSLDRDVVNYVVFLALPLLTGIVSLLIFIGRRIYQARERSGE